MEEFQIRTPVRACMIDITSRVREVVEHSGVEEGICYVFVPHTTAGLTINENADPTVQSDILNELDRTVPWRGSYLHFEGNSAAHIKTSLMGPSHFVLVHKGRLRLGTWQGIFLCEFDGPRRRSVWVKVISE
jgi:secondary thiamine-phosphate synthase enzyme